MNHTIPVAEPSNPTVPEGPESGGGHRQLLEGEGHQHAAWQRPWFIVECYIWGKK